MYLLGQFPSTIPSSRMDTKLLTDFVSSKSKTQLSSVYLIQQEIHNIRYHTQ